MGISWVCLRLEKINVPYYRVACVGDVGENQGNIFPVNTGRTYQTHRWGELDKFYPGSIVEGDRVGADVCIHSDLDFGSAMLPGYHEVVMVPVIYTPRTDVREIFEEVAAS